MYHNQSLYLTRFSPLQDLVSVGFLIDIEAPTKGKGNLQEWHKFEHD